MKKLIIYFLIAISLTSNAQIEPYVDVSAVWKPIMSGGAALDVGVNINKFSLEVNSMALNYSRIGGSVGWQLGERGGEWLGMRPYIGMVYGEYSTSKEDYAPIQSRWNYTVGAKFMIAGWQSNFQFIKAKNPEYYITIGVQVVEIIKWIKR